MNKKKVKWWIIISAIVLVYGLINSVRYERETPNGTQVTSASSETSSEATTESTKQESEIKKNMTSNVAKEKNVATNESVQQPSLQVDQPTQLRLKGRGRSDNGRAEPQYVGLTGYIAASTVEIGSASDYETKFPKNPWYVTTLKQVGDTKFEEQSVKVAHKTEVKVLKQFLTHEGYGSYDGAILVQETGNQKKHYIDVYNFVTHPYWKEDILNAVEQGPVIAKYNGKGGKPNNRDGTWVELKEGTKVVADSVETVGSHEGKIKAHVYKEWELGYGGVDVYFDTDSLSIVY